MNTLKIAFFSATKTDKTSFNNHLKNAAIQITYFDVHLNEKTVPLAQGFDGICVFVNDRLHEAVLVKLAEYNIKLITLRCAGFNNVDAKKASQLGMSVLRVPAYSPMAVAEHAVALMMTLNRKTHKAYNRVRDSNFTIEGLLGFDLYNKTAGIIGTGKIGQQLIPILKGFGMQVLAYDPYPTPVVEQAGAQYVPLETIYQQCDIISLHVPLLPNTRHLIDDHAIAQMKKGVMLINTSRGALMDTNALIKGVKSQQIGYLGIDVYEQEENLFFEDHSEEIIHDDLFERLVTFPNVLITAHQAFFTKEALNQIAEVTLTNMADFAKGTPNPANQVV